MNSNFSPRLFTKYKSEMVDFVSKNLKLTNISQVPKIEKISLSVGFGDHLNNNQVIDAISNDLGSIAAQKPVFCKAKNFVAGFKVRKGMNIGAMVTLRKNKMYEFLDRLINCAMPRMRDFHGLSPKGFDGNGNYSFGIKEHQIFWEVDYNKLMYNSGMNICICTSTKKDNEALFLMKLFGFPFMGGK